MLGNNPVGAILAFAILVTFILFLGILMFLSIPDANVELVREMMIALIAAFAAAYGYYLGSSDGSAKKTEMLNKTEPQG